MPMQLTNNERFTILENALKQKQAVIIDWKASVWDIIEEIKTVLPDLKIQAQDEKQILGDWYEPFILENKEYSIKQEVPKMILEVITIINQHLKSQNKTFVFFDTQDDNYNFILIKLENLQEYTKKGFISL